LLVGKGYYIWQIGRTEGGNVQVIADMARSANLGHLLIKIADGTSSFNITSSGTDLVPPLVSALQGRGIEVWGWQYIYGTKPVEEAQKAVQRIQQTGVSGYIVNAEVEFKEPGKYLAARTFMRTLRDQLPFFPIALSTYRYPSFHPEFPYEDFLNLCDYAMPQVYWTLAHNPREQLTRSINEYRAMTALPIVPTGAAYAQGSWTPSTAELVEFMNAARQYSLSGANFWEWYSARNIAGLWETIASYNWPAQPPMSGISRGRVNTETLNVRSGPGTSYAKVGSLKLGTRVTIFTVQGDWTKINPDLEYWVSSIYLDRLE
jgi:hypothetical protein